MIPFRELPIRRKLALTLVVTSAITLLLTAGAFMVYEWSTFRSATLTNLVTLSRIIAFNSTAALRENNPAEAQEIVGALRAEKDIVSAAIYDVSGQRMAFYSINQPPPEAIPPIPPGNAEFSATHLVVFESIALENRRLGTLMIRSSLAAMQHRFVLYGLIVLSILGTSSLVAFAFSSQIQRHITDPIHELVKTAQAITDRNDYSMRAARYGNDELGALTDAFNRMLDEIKEHEQRLSASEERLRVALGAADMGTWRYYPDRGENIVDDNFCRIYGLPTGKSAVTSAEMEECILPEDRAQTREKLQRALAGPEDQYSFEYRLIGQPALRWVRDRGRVMRRADGNVEYVTGAIVDITERKQAEQEVQRLNTDLEVRVAQRTTELEHANRELEAFTYSVSHDLRGPLRHISGYVEIIHDDPASQLSEQAQVCLGRMGSAAMRLSRLVDSLLNLGHIGRRELVLQRTRLDDLVTTALRELEAETQNRRIEWQRQRLPIVDCDPSLMHIVFVNLLSNALKYSRPRDVAVIHIGMEVERGQTEIVVRDNGVGFDPRFENKLFGVFERLHSASAFEGNGVGLATVDRIIRKHGGRIRARGVLDQGATFYFTFPGL